jgi:hypothetical protein
MHFFAYLNAVSQAMLETAGQETAFKYGKQGAKSVSFERVG